MQRLTPKQRAFHIRKMRSLTRRKMKQNRRIRHQVRRFASWRHIEAPAIFDLDETKHRNKLMNFLGQLRVSIVVEQNPVCLDLVGIEKLNAGATLLFSAELRRAVKLAPTTKIRCIPPRKRKIAQVFQKIEVFKILRHHKRYDCTNDHDVIHWRFATGHDVEGNKYDDILGDYDGRIAEKLSSKLYVGLTEAMTNVHNHAHLLPRKDGLDPKNIVRDWWMFSQDRDSYLQVVFCDLGAGIPETLPIKHPNVWQQLFRVAQMKSSTPSDAEIIQEATKLKVSGTGLRHRGRGLSQMLKAVASDFHGDLRIYSNSGYLEVGTKPKLHDHNTSIMGTLIAWRIPLINHEEKHHGTSYHQYSD